MGFFHLAQNILFKAQAWSEENIWPFPEKYSNFNLSFRDAFLTMALGLFYYFLYSKLGSAAILVFAGMAWAEPAILTFPFNVWASVWFRTPRFWDPLVVEPKLQTLVQPLVFAQIQAEARRVLDTQHLPRFDTVSRHQRRIAADQPWTVFPLFSYDAVNQSNCAQMPILSKILADIGSVRLAMLSVLSDGASIPTHCGFYKGVLRIHLTLHVDVGDENGPPRRYIDVGKQTYAWKEGQMVAFDDTYPHKVVNRVQGRRVVLFLDVDRPTGSVFESTILRLMHVMVRSSPAVRELAALQEQDAS